MARGVQQGDGEVPQGQNGLLGEDGDAPLPLLGIGIQKGVLVVHPAQGAQLSAAKEKPLGEGGLSRVYMGENAHHKSCCIHGQTS